MDPRDFDDRLTAVEQQVRDLNERVRASAQDAAAARVLAGAADRDVTEFGAGLRATAAEVSDFRRATAASFNALREDVTDLGRRMDQRFEVVDQRFEAVDRGFMEMRGKLDAAAAGQQQIVGLLQTLIDGPQTRDGR